MCFAPQRRALFRHRNFQKWSEPLVFLTFWLRNGLRATTACNFSSLISPDVSAPAALASLLFNPPEPQNHEKTQCFATFLPFRAPASSFFWSFLFWLFSLLTAFSSPHIVGSLTSKLPSTMVIFHSYVSLPEGRSRLNALRSVWLNLPLGYLLRLVFKIGHLSIGDFFMLSARNWGRLAKIENMSIHAASIPMGNVCIISGLQC